MNNMYPSKNNIIVFKHFNGARKMLFVPNVIIIDVYDCLAFCSSQGHPP